MNPDLDPNTDLSFTRTLAVPRMLIWECWTKPEHIPHFFIPAPHRVTAVDIDLRVGGRFNTTFEVEGNVMDNHGVYLEVVPGAKLVFTDAYTEGWKPTPEPFMTAILLLADAPGGGTTYTAIARHRNVDTRKAHEDMGFFDGWGTVATQLEVLREGIGEMSGRFATLTFERNAAAPLSALWQAWTAPAARAVWAAPTPSVTVEFPEADTRVGGREVSLCKVDGQPDIRCDVGWLELQQARRSVNYEVISSEGATQSAALVTADFADLGERSRLVVTVQLSSLAGDMEAGYRQGFGAGLDNLAGVAERTMLLQRVIRAPRAVVWGAWMNPETLPQWWGPEGYSCRTKRIDLRQGGEWVFDMIGPDGTVFPNHHRYGEVRPQERFGYALLWGENGPKHADAWASFEDQDGFTKVTLGMIFSTAAEFQGAKGFGAIELGQETLGKLERFVTSR